MDFESHLDPILDHNGTAKDGKWLDAELALFERHATTHGQLTGVSIDVHRNTHSVLNAVDRDRCVQRRAIGNGIHAIDGDDGVGVQVGVQLREHVLSRAGNSRCSRLRIKRCLGAQFGLVDDELVEPNEEIRAGLARRDVATDIVAGNGMVVAESGQRSATAHLDDDERDGGIDLEHGKAALRRLLVEIFRKPRRTLFLALRWPRSLNRAGSPQGRNPSHRAE